MDSRWQPHHDFFSNHKRKRSTLNPVILKYGLPADVAKTIRRQYSTSNSFSREHIAQSWPKGLERSYHRSHHFYEYGQANMNNRKPSKKLEWHERSPIEKKNNFPSVDCERGTMRTLRSSFEKILGPQLLTHCNIPIDDQVDELHFQQVKHRKFEEKRSTVVPTFEEFSRQLKRILTPMLDDSSSGGVFPNSSGLSARVLRERQADTRALEQHLIRSRSEIAERSHEVRSQQSSIDVASQHVKNRLLPPSRDDIQEFEHRVFEGNASELLIEKFNIPMSKEKIRCLQPNTWLNDEVINFYMKLLEEKDEQLCSTNPRRRRSHFFPSFFISKLLDDNRQYAYSNVRRWTRKFDLFEKDKVFCPVNISNYHWTLAVIMVQKKEIHFYDSMGDPGRRYTAGLKQYLVDEFKDKKKGDLDLSEWSEFSPQKSVPQQANGFDCGVFTCMFADFLTHELPLQFSQSDMASLRIKIGLQILKGYLD